MRRKITKKTPKAASGKTAPRFGVAAGIKEVVRTALILVSAAETALHLLRTGYFEFVCLMSAEFCRHDLGTFR